MNRSGFPTELVGLHDGHIVPFQSGADGGHETALTAAEDDNLHEPVAGFGGVRALNRSSSTRMIRSSLARRRRTASTMAAATRKLPTAIPTRARVSFGFILRLYRVGTV